MGLTGFLRRNWLWLGFAVLLAALAANIAAHDGFAPLLVIAAVAAGAFAVPAALGLLSGHRVAKHARTHRGELPGIAAQIHALETSRRKEIRK
jgi:hypothetical protein